MNEMAQRTKLTSLMNKLKVNLLIGLIGMLVIILGTLISPGIMQKELYLVGAILMLLSAALERQLFFVILQVVIVVGAAVGITHWPFLVKAIVPLICGMAALLYFYFTNLLHDRLMQVGCAGLIVIALGFANSNP